MIRRKLFIALLLLCAGLVFFRQNKATVQFRIPAPEAREKVGVDKDEAHRSSIADAVVAESPQVPLKELKSTAPSSYDDGSKKAKPYKAPPPEYKRIQERLKERRKERLEERRQKKGPKNDPVRERIIEKQRQSRISSTTKKRVESLKRIHHSRDYPVSMAERGMGRVDPVALENSFKDVKSQHCLTSSCFEATAKTMARAFPDRLDKADWCIPTTNSSSSNDGQANAIDDHPQHQGLILVKVPKAASSTTAAVVLRLGHRQHCNMSYVHWQHKHAYKEYAKRDRQRSVMILSVRHPAQQIVSNVFWAYVTLRRTPPSSLTDEFLVRRVKSFGTNLGMLRHRQGGFTTQFAALEKIPRDSAWNKTSMDLIHPQDTIARVKAIMDGYDFILVVERMDESLVALSLLLGVPVGDVLVTSSKVSAPMKGSLVNGTFTMSEKDQQQQVSYLYSKRHKKCVPIRESFVPPLLKRYLESDHFVSQMYGDYILHTAANQSLDLTIDRLGRERFANAMKEYQYWKRLEQTQCASSVEFPCSNAGKPQLAKAEENCYSGDLGCGHQCVDDMLDSGKEDSL